MADARPLATRTRALTLYLVVVGAVAALGCRQEPAAVTSIRVVSTWSNLAPVQLRFLFFTSTGDSISPGVVTRPEMPTTRPLPSGSDLVVYLNDRYVGQTVVCLIDAYAPGGRLIKSAQGMAVVKRKEEVRLVIDLGGPVADGGASDAPVSGIDLPIGARCTAKNQCQTGFCEDGFCCDKSCSNALCVACNVAGQEGKCVPAPEGSDDAKCVAAPPETCGVDGTCDGNGACRKYPAGVRCGPGTCSGSSVTAASTCDGAGACMPGPAVPCAPFACGVEGGVARCNETCSDGTGCIPGVMCENGSCGPRLDGANCKQDGDCQSGFCVGGTCCNSKCDRDQVCFSCRLPGALGSCQPVPFGGKDPADRCPETPAASCGTNGKCDGRGACAKHSPGTICRDAVCAGDSALSAASRCNGLGVCVEGGSVNCAPYQCKNGACTGSCTSASECTGEAPMCTGGSCGPKGLGQPCTAASQCASGHCADGVCCDEACAGDCRTCATGPQPGRCSLIAAGGADTKGRCAALAPASCGTDGTCDGAGSCRRHPAGTVCGGSSCNPATHMRQLPATCDTTGRCVAGAMASCGPYKCNGPMACFSACGSDADCQAPSICQGGSCGLRAGGAACNAGSECTSGNCVDGVCCASASCGTCQACNLAGSIGVCAPIAFGMPDHRGRCVGTAPSSCGDDGVCDGAGACRKHAAGTTCGTQRCSDDGLGLILTPQCDGRGLCVIRPPQTCAPYRCDAAAAACRTSCTSAADCSAPNLCSVNGSCGNVKPLGRTCTAASECASGFCTNGYCCEAASCGRCQSCSVTGRLGTCSPVSAGSTDPSGMCASTAPNTCGTNGRCDGAGGCQLHSTSQSCRSGSCNNNVATSPANCNGMGMCPAATTRDCGAYRCSSGTCPSSCSSDTQCVTPNTCNGGTCRLKSQGAACSSGSQCATGNCVNMVCCNSSSCGSCRACNVPGFVGFCQPVANGASDPAGMCQTTAVSSCGTDGRCDGAGGCRMYAAGTVCQAASCSGATFNRADVCNGQGSCTDGGTDSCSPYLCNTSNPGCFSSCTSDAQCVRFCRETTRQCQ